MRTLHSCALALLLLPACSRELALPELKQPPQLDAFDAGGFAGSALALSGRNLGDRATTQVLFGARPGTIESVDGGTLTVLVPENATDGPVTVETPQGSASGGHFHYRGIGHPAAPFPRTAIALGPHPTRALPLGDRIALLDDRYDSITLLNSGAALFDRRVPPFFVGAPALVFGDGEKPWVYDAADGKLHQFDIAGAPTELQSIPLLDANQQPLLDAFSPAASPDGAFFAIADGQGGVLFVDVTTGRQFDVPVPGVTDIFTLQFATPTRLFGAANDALFAIADVGAGNSVSVGSAFTGDASPAGSRAQGSRLFAAILTDSPDSIVSMAYLRSDGQIGLAEANPGGSDLPVLPAGITQALPSVLDTPDLFAFASQGEALLVGDIQNATVLSISIDPATGKATPAATQALPGLVSLEAGSGATDGLVIAGSTAIDGAVLLLPSSGKVRSISANAGLSWVVAEDNDVVLTSSYGTLTVDSNLGQQGITRSPLLLNAVTESEGGILGVGGATLYLRDRAEPVNGFRRLAVAAQGIASAAASADGRWAATISASALGDTATVELFPLAGNAAPAPAPLSIPSAGNEQLVFVDDVLYGLFSQDSGNARLVRFRRDTLQIEAAQPLAEQPFTLLAGKQFGGVVTATADSGDLPPRLQAWTAAGVFGELELLPALGLPSAQSADGRTLVVVTSPDTPGFLTTPSVIDLFELDGPPSAPTLTLRTHLDPGVFVESVTSSPNGARFYATTSGVNELLVIE